MINSGLVIALRAVEMLCLQSLVRPRDLENLTGFGITLLPSTNRGKAGTVDRGWRRSTRRRRCTPRSRSHCSTPRPRSGGGTGSTGTARGRVAPTTRSSFPASDPSSSQFNPGRRPFASASSAKRAHRRTLPTGRRRARSGGDAETLFAWLAVTSGGLRDSVRARANGWRGRGVANPGCRRRSVPARVSSRPARARRRGRDG